jgi:nicotinamidase-related amidase
MKPALLVIDMQNVSYAGESQRSMDRAARVINRAVELFRARVCPIVWVQNEVNEPDPARRIAKYEIISAFQPEKTEKRIAKSYLNSFFKTDLAEYLALEAVDTVIVSGYSAEYCVLSAYRGAEECGFTPIVLKDGIACERPERIRFVEDMCDTIYGDDVWK